MISPENILFTGANGLLGSEFKKQMPEMIFTNRQSFDIENYDQMEEYIRSRNIQTIIHAAAFTSPPKVEDDPIKAIVTNIIGTANIVELCMQKGIKLIYISTDYVFKGDKGNYKEDDPVSPVNKYALSKLGGECAVRLYNNSLIIRTSFGPNIFPYQKAFIDQWTSRLSVSQVVKKIIAILDTDINGIIHIGDKRRTVYGYAKSLDPTKEIGEMSIKNVGFTVPQDTSLDTSKYDEIIKNKGNS